MNWVVLNWHWKYQCKLMILYIHIYVCYCLVAKFCLTHLRPMDCSSPGSSVHGISQARILEWVAISFSRGSSWPRDQTQVDCITGRFFTTESPGKPHTYIYLTNKHSNKIIMSSIHYQGLRGTTLNSMRTFGTQILVLKPFSRIQSSSEMAHSRAKAVEYKTSLENWGKEVINEWWGRVKRTQGTHRDSQWPNINTKIYHTQASLMVQWLRILLPMQGKVKKLLVTQSRLTRCDPMDCSPPSASVHGIFQTSILEWVVIPFSRGCSWPKDWTWVSCIAGRFFNHLSHLGSPQFIYLAASGSCCMWDLVPWPRIKPWPPALGVQSLNHWITGEVNIRIRTSLMG